MVDYFDGIKTVINDFSTRHHGSEKWIETSDRFEEWKKSSHKDPNEFQDPLFCDKYAEYFFPRRCEMFYQLLQDLCSDCMEAKDVIDQARNIYSFGCGPGPEIAAILTFIRETMNRNDNSINITAVDRVDYWNNYIKLMRKFTTEKSSSCLLDFQSYTLSRATIDRVPDNQDVCIFCYSDVMKLMDVMLEIQRKFKLVLVIDQDWNGSSKRLGTSGFQNRQFLYDKHKNRFYSYFYKDDVVRIPMGNETDNTDTSNRENKYKIGELPPNEVDKIEISIERDPDTTRRSKRSNAKKCCLIL